MPWASYGRVFAAQNEMCSRLLSNLDHLSDLIDLTDQLGSLQHISGTAG